MTRRRITLAAALFAATGTIGHAQSPSGSPATGAKIDRDSFRYQRRVPRGVAGVAWMRLDLAALAHSRIADVRLVSSNGFQVPFLIEDDPIPLRVTLPALRPVSADEARRVEGGAAGSRRSVYVLSLPFPSMPPGRLVLETSSRVFEREVRLLARNDGRRNRATGEWTPQARASWRHSEPEIAARPLALDLPSLFTADARVVIDEGDNPPLPLEKPVLEFRTWRLRFVRESADELWLVYGRADIEAPRYDLALLDESLRLAPAVEVVADAETPQPRPDAERRSRLLFWIVLVASIVALLAVVARLLRPGSQER